MDANKFIQKQGLRWRCREHPKFPCDFICLDGNSKDRFVCFNCVQKQSIPFQNLVSMSCVLAANKYDILEAYPPLNDQELSDRLRNTNLQQHLEEIGAYFKKLKEDFEIELRAAEQRAKQSLILQERVSQQLSEGYVRIAEIEKLKELILSEKKSAEKDLDVFIRDKWNRAEENRKVMEDLINQYEGVSQFSSEEPHRIASEMIENLKTVKFFQQAIQQSQASLIKSTFNTSQQMEITKVGNSIQVKRGAYDNGEWDQVFIDPIINPLKKYILHIELEQNSRNRNQQLFFGLVKDEGKDLNAGDIQQMCYSPQSEGYGISKIIKRSQMRSRNQYDDWDETGKLSFEIRIDLKKQFLRVGSLPDYSSITELDNPNQIDPKVAYRFFFSMYTQGDIIRITNIRTVSHFDEKM